MDQVYMNAVMLITGQGGVDAGGASTSVAGNTPLAALAILLQACPSHQAAKIKPVLASITTTDTSR